ncbi:hypothetical protein CspeluHIS016_0800800 [Cutaneotrichosporon spelunceum]|uniref:Zn(2)-C6 fungal-type domain-containing protein n=1 Tax=Cutaneotrichosporon spelunceum TaxID=1672016 RepID=A0AAD3TZ13_9TREE|nr:hypothetical protein CspeluHIS016_0800800 [Cutaneotrichosporon spelunceum]
MNGSRPESPEHDDRRHRPAPYPQPARSHSNQSGQSPDEDGRRAALTSCEACRKGKRRCEPSPLVSIDHPDAAKLPCARCRRFALECVRMRVSRRKGPAPVDLSAISDAQHGYGHSEDVKPAVDVAFPLPNPITSPSFPLLAVTSPNVDMIATDNLDQVVSPSVVENIIGLFFDYVYPLTPCLHRPTFLADLAARRDKTDPIFFALTLCVLASTLVQVPRKLVNLQKEEVEILARRCVRVARHKVAYIWDEPSPMRSEFVVIFYLEGIVHLILGNNTAHVVVTAQANQCALALRLNEESSYDGLNPIETEVRRRIYWLLFQADKSTACNRSRTINLRLDDAPGLRLPTEVDDEQITSDGIIPQPPGRTPTIAGFNIVTNLFRALNDALLLQRRRTPPSIEGIIADLNTIARLSDEITDITNNVASPLRIRFSSKHDSRANSPGQGWEEDMETRLRDFFAGVTAQDSINSFRVMQGNILATRQVVRLVLLQTRNALLTQLGTLTNLPAAAVPGLAGSRATETPLDIAHDLLDGLNNLPGECVAVNGPSLVQKVRYVAIQLLDGTTLPSQQVVRAQNLLMQFLSVLGIIEELYSFGRDVSVE